MIRSLTLEDLPRLAELHLRCFPDSDMTLEEQRKISHDVYERLFPALYINHPWSDERFPCLISENRKGELTGMLAVMNRRFEADGRRLDAAVSAELFVDPDSRSSLSGVQLLKKLLNGPQHLTIADTANDTTQRIWNQLGGLSLPVYGMSWMLLSDPCRFAVHLASTRTRLARPATLFARAGDQILGRIRKPFPREADPAVSSRPLTRDEFVALAPTMSSRVEIRPVYSDDDVHWLWDRLNFIARDAGPAQQFAVLRNEKAVGWFIWQFRPGRIARVSQLVAQSGEELTVVSEMARTLRRAGIAGAIGRLQPEFLPALQRARCLFVRRSRHVLVHSHDDQILNSFRKGSAFLSMLDGEGAVQLWNDPESALQQLEASERKAHVIPIGRVREEASC